MKGYAYDFLAILHAITVIFTLLWLPFGKFFHIFMRPAQLGVSFYKDVGAAGRAGGVPPLRPAVRLATPRRGPDRGGAAARLPLRAPGGGGRSLPVDLPGLPPEAARPRPGRRAWRPRIRRRSARMATEAPDTPDLLAKFGPLRAYQSGQRLDTAVERRPAGEDPLLLLRPAVRHPAQGEGQPGHRVRALGRLPVQPGDALPEGRPPVPAGLPPRPADLGLRPRPVEARGVPGGPLRRGDPARGRRGPADPVDVRQRRLRRARRGEHDDREVLPARASSPGSA